MDNKTIEQLREKHKSVDLLEMCRILAKSESTSHLVDWFGDYALYEPALNVTSDDILLAYDKLKSFAQPQNIEASRSVKENISRGLSRAMPGHVLVNAWRKNNYDDDRHLFVVLAQNSRTSDYVVWTAWNEYTQSLNHGHYALSESDVNEVLSEHLYSDSSKPVCPEYVHQPSRVSNATSSAEDVDELEAENSRTI